MNVHNWMFPSYLVVPVRYETPVDGTWFPCTVQGNPFDLGSLMKDWLGDQRGGSEWEPIKIFPKGWTWPMPQIHNQGSPHDFPRSRSHNRPTNPRNKPQLKATRKCNTGSKDLGNLRSPRRTVRGDRADGPCGLGRRSKNGPQTTSMHPPKFCRSASSTRMVRSSRTVRPHWVDGPANNFQPKPTKWTDRNEATQLLVKNMKNSQLSGSSLTVRWPGADDPPGADRAARARKWEVNPSYPSMDLPNSLSS
jgi:hypothetical protein